MNIKFNSFGVYIYLNLNPHNIWAEQQGFAYLF
jgi:hypothetical protein